MLRRLASVSTLAATFCAVVALNQPAHAGPGESEFTSLTNRARASAGLRGYTVSSDLVALARRHSAEMAAKGTIYHNDNIGNDVSGWRAVGENVGMGGSASSIHNAFMNSTAHRNNILDTDFTQVGIGTAVDKNGILYVTEVFRQPVGSTTVVRQPAPRRTTTVTRTRTPARTVTAPRPAPAKTPSAAAILQAKLAAAAAVANHAGSDGALDRAVTYVEVMGALS